MHLKTPLVATAALLLLAPSAARAEERVCSGAIGAETVDNLRVPEGATCTLNGTEVKGTITVQRAATLRASSIRVVGNVQAENAADVVVSGATIGGSVQVKQGGGADLTGNAITGDVQYDANSARLNVRENRVNGNVQVVGNASQATIYDNTIGANLQCKENNPAPVGARNDVKGSAEDQCASFGGGAGATSLPSPSPSPAPAPAPAPSGDEDDDDDDRAARVTLSVRRTARHHVLRGRAGAARRAAVQIRRRGRWVTVKRFTTASDGRYGVRLKRTGTRRTVRVASNGRASSARVLRG